MRPLHCVLALVVVVYVSTATCTNLPYYSSTGSAGSGTGSNIPDQGIYWPWNTPRGVLPPVAVTSASALNPYVQYDLYHVIWQTKTPVHNITFPSNYMTSDMTIMESYTTKQHTYFHAAFTSQTRALAWGNYMTSYNGMTCDNIMMIVYGGAEERLWSFNSTTLPRLRLHYSYLSSRHRIPTSLSTGTWNDNTYYVTARSSNGEFRMITYPYIQSIQPIFQSIIQEQHDINITQTEWDTVKVYCRGLMIFSYTTSRGSELEHQGAFQWLSLPPRSSRYMLSNTYYLLVSYTSLSGVTLQRMHMYTTFKQAQAVQQWISWYTTSYNSPSHRSSSIMYYQYQSINSMINNYQDYTTLTYNYDWITMKSTTNQPNVITSTSWGDLSINQRTFIIVYPTSVVVIAFVILYLVHRCVKPRYTNMSRSPISPAFHHITCLLILLSIASLILLIVSLCVKRFSTVSVYFDTMKQASYGPFQVDQEWDYVAWLHVRKTAQVMSPVTGVCMLISLITSCSLIGHIKNHLMSYRMIFVAVMAFVFSLCSTLVWIPVHMSLQDPNLEYVLISDNSGNHMLMNVQDTQSQSSPILIDSNGYYQRYATMQSQHMGIGYILLMAATAIHAVILILCIIVHKEYARHNNNNNTSAHDTEGLQLVDVGSPYYYRDVPTNPAVMPVPTRAAASMYAVATPSTVVAPPPFMFATVPASAPAPVAVPVAYAPPMYHPPPAADVAEPIYQPISAAPWPATTTTTAYPSLPIDVPASAPNTHYQRLL